MRWDKTLSLVAYHSILSHVLSEVSPISSLISSQYCIILKEWRVYNLTNVPNNFEIHVI